VLKGRVQYLVNQGAHQQGYTAGMDQALDEIIVVNEIKTLGPHGLSGGILPGLQEESQGAEEGILHEHPGPGLTYQIM
jgi:hypothetical protein